MLSLIYLESKLEDELKANRLLNGISINQSESTFVKEILIIIPLTTRARIIEDIIEIIKRFGVVYGFSRKSIFDIFDTIWANRLNLEYDILHSYLTFVGFSGNVEEFFEKYWNIIKVTIDFDLTDPNYIEASNIIFDYYLSIIKLKYDQQYILNARDFYFMNKVVEYYNDFENIEKYKIFNKFCDRFAHVASFTNYIFGLKTLGKEYHSNYFLIESSIYNVDLDEAIQFYHANKDNLTFAQNWLEKQKKLASDNI